MMASLAKRCVLISLLACGGYIGNMYAIPVAFGVSFIFGSIFSIIALVFFGIVPGLVVSLIASGYTYQLWNHPYAIVIFACEIVWLGYFLKRKKRNFLLIDLSYWLFAGSPLVFFFYEGIMELGLQHASLIALKQSINGILNTVLAWIFLSLPPVTARIDSHSPSSTRVLTSEQVIFQLIAAFLLIPSLGMLLLISGRDVNRSQQEVVRSLNEDSHVIADTLTRWVDRHVLAIQTASLEAALEDTLVSSQDLQKKLRRIHSLFPDFHNIFIGNDSATTIAFHPSVNEKGESTIGINFKDRAWFRELKKTLKPTVSDVFVGRGGIFVPIFTISVPFVRNGSLSHFALGAINLDKMAAVLTSSVSNRQEIFTVVDRNHKVIVSTDPGRKPLHDAELFARATKMDLGDNVTLVVPGNRKNISTMNAYKGAYYHTTVPITNTPWHLNIEFPLAPIQHHHYQNAIWGLTGAMLLLLLMSAIMAFLGKYLTASLHELGQVTIGLPQKIKDQQRISWPSSRLDEVHRLITNFQSSANSLSQTFAEIKEINTHLEEMIADRTEQLQQERGRLKEIVSERDIILENATVGITLVRRRKQVWSNQAMLDLFGSTSVGTNIPTRKFYRSDEEYQRLGTEAYPVLARGEAFSTDTVMRHADGSDVIISLHGRAINPEDPENGSIWIFEDITQRKQMEKALRQSETKFRHLFQIAAIPLFYMGSNGVTLALNSKFVELFGYDMTDIPTLETWLEKAYPDREYRQWAINTWKTGREKARREQTDLREEEYEITCKNGEVRSVLIGGSSIDDHFLATFIDVTEIKKANRAKSAFFSSMSHELRTPLNAILGYTQIFNMDDTLSKKRLQGIKTIHQAAEHLLMIINDILDMSKIEAGKLRLVEGELQLLPFLENIIDFFSRSAHEKDLALSLETDRSLLPHVIRADELRLRQILYNLISNSLKFTSKGFCKLYAGATAVGDHRSLITISVEDSGIGIPENDQAEIFKPFRQIGDHLKHESGTGLGLAISRQLAQLMGGDIVLESPCNTSPAEGEGKGSRFSITFETNVSESPRATQTLETKIPIGYESLREPKQPAKILVVDDNHSNRAVLNETLTPLGFVVSEAVDGSQVIEAGVKTSPDLILMDLRMPKIDGFSALELLMKNERLDHIPVIAITASVLEDSDLRQQCLNHGFRDLIEKPYNALELVKKIENLLPIRLIYKDISGERQEEDLDHLEMPPAEELQKLSKYLSEGDIEAIMAQAETIGGLDNGRYLGYSRVLKASAENFNFSKLEKIISPGKDQ